MDRFKEKLKIAVTNHYTKIQSTFNDLYGYSLYTEDGLSSIGPVCNRESDITVSETDEMYIYYRYGAVEWQHFEDFGFFDEVNKELNKIMDCENPKWSKKRQNILDSCLSVLTTLDQEGMFGSKNSNRFVVMCLSDSDDPIMDKSAKILNSKSVYQSYTQEFS